MTTPDQVMQDREQWLNIAADLIRSEVFAPCGLPNFAHPYRISCGFAQGSRKAIGQCFPRAASADSTNEIYISPTLASPVRTNATVGAAVLETLVHELLHALDDCRSKHGRDWQRWARRVGLEGKATATYAGTKLTRKLGMIAIACGDYPHAALTVTARDKARQLKLECLDCGAVWRMSQKWRAQVTCCPCCASQNVNTSAAPE
jgi:predicted SprT family Zn-dependent metalloprotease